MKFHCCHLYVNILHNHQLSVFQIIQVVVQHVKSRFKTCYFHNFRGNYNEMCKSKYLFLPLKNRKEKVPVNAVVFMFQCAFRVPGKWLIPFTVFWKLFLSCTFSVVLKEPVYSFPEVKLFVWHALKYLHKVIKTIFE